jgi:hypothetical protein
MPSPSDITGGTPVCNGADCGGGDYVRETGDDVFTDESDTIPFGLGSYKPPWWHVLAALIIGLIVGWMVGFPCGRSRMCYKDKEVAAETDMSEEDTEVPTKSRDAGAPMTTTTSNRSAPQIPLGAAPPVGSTVRMVAPGSVPGSTVRMVTVGSPPPNVTDAIFNALDRNHDGVISPQEFGVLPAGMIQSLRSGAQAQPAAVVSPRTAARPLLTNAQ